MCMGITNIILWYFLLLHSNMSSVQSKACPFLLFFFFFFTDSQLYTQTNLVFWRKNWTALILGKILGALPKIPEQLFSDESSFSNANPTIILAVEI